MIDVFSLQLVDDGAFKNVEEINVALLLAIVDQLSRLVFFYRYIFPYQFSHCLRQVSEWAHLPQLVVHPLTWVLASPEDRKFRLFLG